MAINVDKSVADHVEIFNGSQCSLPTGQLGHRTGPSVHASKARQASDSVTPQSSMCRSMRGQRGFTTINALLSMSFPKFNIPQTHRVLRRRTL